MVRVGEDAAEPFALCLQISARAGQQRKPRSGLVEFHLQQPGAFPHPLDTRPEPDNPGLSRHACQVAGHWTRDDAVALFGVRQEPGRGHDLACDGKGEVAVQRHHGERVPDVLRQIAVRSCPAHLGDGAGIEAAFVQPRRERPPQREFATLRPVPGLRRGQCEQLRAPERPAAQAEGRAAAVAGAGLVGRIHVLARKPGADFRPAPPLRRIACEQPTEKQPGACVEVGGHHGTLRDDVQEECAVVHALEATAAGGLLQGDHAERPPVGGGAHSADDGFRRRVPGQAERRDRLKVEVGEPRRTETRHDEFERLRLAHEDVLRPEVAVAQPGFREGRQRASQPVDQVPQPFRVRVREAEPRERAARDPLHDVVCPVA